MNDDQKAHKRRRQSADYAQKRWVLVGKVVRERTREDKAILWRKRNARWIKANPEKNRIRSNRYYLRNSWRVKERVARRRALQLRAMPGWANRFFINEAYHLASLRTRMLGFPWHVDHIVPLISEIVCGLHTHDNLRVISGKENLAKGNRYWPDMPVESVTSALHSESLRGMQ